MTSEVTQAALEPCPWCGTVEHLSFQWPGSMTADMPDSRCRVVCTHIDHGTAVGVVGPTAYGKFAAATAWNTRLTAQSGDGRSGAGEPWPGCYADLQERRVVTLAKLGLMLSIMVSGEAAEVVGYDAADLYAEVLMALAIEDAEDTDIALEVARDHPSGDCLHRIPCPPVTEEAEKVAAWLEQYPSPMNDLDMAMRISQICARIRAGAHRKSDATPSGEAGEGEPNGVAENKAGGLWYRRWHTAQTRVNELEATLANPPKHKFWGAGERDCPREIKAPNGELHTLRCKVCGMDNPSDNICPAALNARQSGEGEREKFLTAYVSEDSKIIGIEHDADADWHKVHDAHIALWNRLEERIRDREKCPRKPAIRATDDAEGA